MPLSQPISLSLPLTVTHTFTNTNTALFTYLASKHQRYGVVGACYFAVAQHVANVRGASWSRAGETF